MSLKPVELQIALPRTHDAGKVQNNLQQRPALDQQQLAGQNIKHSQEISLRSTGLTSLPNRRCGMAARGAALAVSLIRASRISWRTPMMPNILIKGTV